MEPPPQFFVCSGKGPMFFLWVGVQAALRRPCCRSEDAQCCFLSRLRWGGEAGAGASCCPQDTLPAGPVAIRLWIKARAGKSTVPSLQAKELLLVQPARASRGACPSAVLSRR